MARSPLHRRLDRLEQTAIGEHIVYEAGDDIPEEDHERFRRVVIGETAPNSTVVRIQRFFPPDLPPRLLDRRPMSARARDLTATTGADPVGLQQRHAASVPARLYEEEVIPKHNPVLSYRPRGIDTDADDM
jgi:hypothetical protein